MSVFPVHVRNCNFDGVVVTIAGIVHCGDLCSCNKILFLSCRQGAVREGRTSLCAIITVIQSGVFELVPVTTVVFHGHRCSPVLAVKFYRSVQFSPGVGSSAD